MKPSAGASIETANFSARPVERRRQRRRVGVVADDGVGAAVGEDVAGLGRRQPPVQPQDPAAQLAGRRG